VLSKLNTSGADKKVEICSQATSGKSTAEDMPTANVRFSKAAACGRLLRTLLKITVAEAIGDAWVH
jgi:hypothetical protein